MYTILGKQNLGERLKLMVIGAPEVARKASAGQFVILRIDEFGERIPLTIADFDRNSGAVTIVFQEVGKTTLQLGTLDPGDGITTFVGPLGHPSEIEKYGSVICVGGGVGVAPMFPIARALNAAGNHVISIIGARTKELIFWEERLRVVSQSVITCTDDGSYGRKALVTEPLREILQQRSSAIARVWAIGPAIMMKYCAATTREFGVPTVVSLNTIMIDGTGMCGGCRVQTLDGPKFVCVDGPEFDAHAVDWDLLMARQQYYIREEEEATQSWIHHCRMEEQQTCE